MATFYEIQTPDIHAEDAWDGAGLPPGPRAALWVLAGLIVALAAPYAVVALAGEPAPDGDDVLAELATARAWIPGDPPPFANHFGMKWEGDRALTAAGDAALALAEGVDDGDDSDAPTDRAFTVADEDDHGSADGDGTARAEAGDDGPGDDAADSDAPPMDGPVGPPAPPNPFARLSIPASAFEGVTAEIEDPNGAMDHFFEALGRTALGEDGAVTRITQWGDSAIAADGMTGAARVLFQKQFGDAGHGFSMISQPTPWYRRKHVTFETTGWRSQAYIRRQADDGRYGFGGVAAMGYLGARASWATVDEGPIGRRASRFTVYYHRDRRLGDLAVRVDGEELTVLETATEGGPEDAVHVEAVPDGPHTFEIRNVGGGLTRVYGVAIERDVPGVVYDGVGVVGARAARQLNIDDAHWGRVLKQRSPDLYILMYGGNALKDSTTKERYQADLERVLARYRDALPERSCLVMSPLDHGERHRGRIRTVPRMYELMEAQRAAALAQGCAWYSLFDAMGGEGAMGVWHDEGLANSDLAHATAKGSKVLGKLFYLSTVKGFHDWLARTSRQVSSEREETQVPPTWRGSKANDGVSTHPQ